MTAIRRYLSLHRQNFCESMVRLFRQPFATTLTVLVIAIALGLPAGLRVFVINAQSLSASWDSAVDLTVFLGTAIDDDRVRSLVQELEERPDVRAVQWITRDDALREFRERSGFGEALDVLGENPLPHTLVVSPQSGASGDVEGLAAELEELSETDSVQLDTDWLLRLRAMLALVERLLLIATLLLGVAVVIIIGNTIRLEINNRRDEIEVMKLVGGSDGFIRRPFLYLGFFYGLFGAVGSVLLIGGTLYLIRGPVASLAGLYGSSFALSGLAPSDLFGLLGGGAALGWAGAGLATARHLRAIEPS
jgi:cell division transport system permease protein